MTETTEKLPTGFMLQDEVIESITIMTAEELQTVLRAAVSYFRGEDVEEPDGSGIVILTFRMLRQDIDNGLLKYRETCERNSRIARERYSGNSQSTARNDPSPTIPDTNANTDTNTNSDSYSDAKAGSARRTAAQRQKRLTAQEKKKAEEEKDNLLWLQHYLDTHRIRTDDAPERGGESSSPDAAGSRSCFT